MDEDSWRPGGHGGPGWENSYKGTREPAAAVRQFLVRLCVMPNDTLTVEHPHNGSVFIEARHLWDLVNYAEEGYDASGVIIGRE